MPLWRLSKSNPGGFSTESVLGRDSLRFLFLPVLLLFNDFFQQEGNFGAVNEDNYREHFDWKGGGADKSLRPPAVAFIVRVENQSLTTSPIIVTS